MATVPAMTTTNTTPRNHASITRSMFIPSARRQRRSLSNLHFPCHGILPSSRLATRRLSSLRSILPDTDQCIDTPLHVPCRPGRLSTNLSTVYTFDTDFRCTHAHISRIRPNSSIFPPNP